MLERQPTLNEDSKHITPSTVEMCPGTGRSSIKHSISLFDEANTTNRTIHTRSKKKMPVQFYLCCLQRTDRPKDA